MSDKSPPVPENPSLYPKTLSDLWFALRFTTVSDAFSWLFYRRADLTNVITWAELPPELVSVVKSVTNQTHLWPSEQRDVARELAGHFRDGLDSSATTAQLIERFGDQRQTALMIRRARLRCRSAFWHLSSLALRTACMAFGLLFVVYLVLSARFYYSHPTITHHYVQEINAKSQQIAENDRAWPLYRDVILKLPPYPGTKSHNWSQFGRWYRPCHESPESAHWEELLAFVAMNQDLIKLARAGTEKPKLGFVFGDDQDRGFFWYEAEPSPDAFLESIFVSHIHSLNHIASLLVADAIVAANHDEADRWMKDLQGIIALAEQSHPDPILYEELLSIDFFRKALALVRDSLEEHPQLLTDEQLADVAHRLASYEGGGTLRPNLDYEKTWIEDILQRCFTDDGHGDGHFTYEGMNFLEKYCSPLKTASSMSITLGKDFGPGALLTMPGRRESREQAMDLLNAFEKSHRGPLHTWDPPSKQRPNQVTSRNGNHEQSAVEEIRFLLVSVLFQGVQGIQHYYEEYEQIAQDRDGTLTAIALERFRRSHGSWPETLDNLVPDYLPELPLDRFTGEPLRYRIKEGQPLVYSCGPDQQDDGGRHYSNQYHIFQRLKILVKSTAAGEGYDWVIVPRQRAADPEDE